MTMMCNRDRSNLLEELKEFRKRIMDLGVESCELGILENGKISGSFLIDSTTKFICALDPDNGDGETSWYEDV